MGEAKRRDESAGAADRRVGGGGAADRGETKAAPVVGEAVPVRVASCAGCKFRLSEGANHFCRRNPPTAFLVPGQNRLGHVQAQQMSAWPPVALTQWCGEYRPKLET